MMLSEQFLRIRVWIEETREHRPFEGEMDKVVHVGEGLHRKSVEEVGSNRLFTRLEKLSFVFCLYLDD